MYAKNERVEGIIFNQVKGGFTVDLEGAVAFLPRSQVDIRPIRDIGPLMNVSQPFQILKMDKRRGNIVVSRRAILEESRAEQRSEIVQQLEEGQIVDGVVKNITDYGAFVDLGGIDGLLHVTDIAWRRVNHPTEVLSIGETIKVQIIRINHESHRISLGMKQLQADPVGRHRGEVSGRRQVHRPRHQHHRLRRVRRTGAGHRRPDPRLRNELDQKERPPRQDRLHFAGSGSHGARGRSRQAPHFAGPQADPAEPVGELRREVPDRVHHRRRSQEQDRIRLFIGLDGDVDGMVHLSDLDWQKPGEQALDEYNRGDIVKAKVLDVDVEKERISLGIKQLAAGEVADTSGDGLRKGSVVTGTVTEVNDGGIEVRLADSEMTAFIRRADLSRDRNDQRPERFSRARRSTRASPSTTRRPARSLSRSRRSKSPKKRKRSPTTVRLTRALRSATSWARPSRIAKRSDATRHPRGSGMTLTSVLLTLSRPAR